MTLNEWLGQQTKSLSSAGVPTARLDLLVLLEDKLQKDKSHLLAHPETVLQGRTLQILDSQAKRRASHEPLAYIRGKSEFYGRDFLVTADTLQPRPETETIIALLKKLPAALINDGPLHIVDVGTGSGCLAITAKLELPRAQVFGLDISEACLNIARQNAESFSVAIDFQKGNLLEPLLGAVLQGTTIILANLPYVPDEHTVNQAVMFEPKISIFGGPDGLNVYRELFKQVAAAANKPRAVLCESLPYQHETLTKIAEAASYKLITSEDFTQLFERAFSQ